MRGGGDMAVRSVSWQDSVDKHRQDVVDYI